MKNISKNFYILLLIFFAIMIGNSYVSYHRLYKIKSNWIFYLHEIDKKEILISKLKGVIGYGGVIHHFKNYLLRGNEKYFVKTNDNILTVKSIIIEYNSIKTVSSEEKKRLNILLDTFNQYQSFLLKIEKNRKDMTINQIDKLIKIDDKPALNAFYWLQDNQKKSKLTATDRLNLAVNNSVLSLGYTLLLSMGLFTLFFIYVRKKINHAHYLLKKNLNEQAIINSLLQIPLSSKISLEKKLDIAFKQIVSTPWLILKDRGGIFTTEEDGLKLIYSNNLGEKIENICFKIKKGRCLCGRALETKKTIHAGRIDERHENIYVGISPHGHYCIPLKSNNDVIGVIVLYLPHGHQRNEKEISFLESCADILGTLIVSHFNEIELIKTREKALRAEKAKSEFLANMSHEIRTPMNAVIGFSGLMLDSELTKEQRENVQSINNSGKNLLQIINDILDFSKVEANKIELENIDFCLEQMISEVMDIIKQQTTNNVELLCTFDSKLADFYNADSLRVRQILLNLLSNAAKFTKNGHIHLKTDILKIENNKSVLRFTVEDTGKGIKEEYLKNIFAPFGQEDGSTTRKFGGTGLGVSIAKKLANLMEGDIKFESIVNKGTTVTLTITVNNLHNSVNTPNTLSLKKLKGKKIWAIDDNKNTLKAISDLCFMAGIEYSSFTIPNKFLHFIDNNSLLPDFLLIDLIMPEMNGYDLLTEIRKREHFKNIPAIALTLDIHQEVNQKVKEYSFIKLLPKPLFKNAFYNILLTVANSDKQEKTDNQHTKEEVKMKDGVILVVEDDEVNVMLIEKQLQKLGYRCEIANNGIKALEKFKTQSFNLILMDCLMPEMDGLETTEKIRELEQNLETHTTIVAVTANAFKEDREKCLRAGMDDYISKPIDIAKLKNILSKYIVNEDIVKIFDENALWNLVGHDKEILGNLINNFTAQHEILLNNIKQAIFNKNARDVEMSAHKFKGAVGNFFAKEISENVFQLEQNGKNNQLYGCEKKLKEIVLKMPFLIDGLKEILNAK